MNDKIKTCSSVTIMGIVAIAISSNPFIFAQSSSNQTGNESTSTKSNSTANNSSIICSDSLGAAIKAFLFRDENKALMHMNEADKTITGAAKMNLDAAISALQSGDTNMAKEHLAKSQYACGIPDVF